jgi:uncharacterized peroxidase-related enzyme
MSRIALVDPAAPGPAAPLLAAVKAKLGAVPNIFRAMARSPQALEAYLGFSGALAGGALPAATRERVALAVAEANGCDYCVAAHTAIGRMTGLDADEIVAARRGTSADKKEAAAVGFARALLAARGAVAPVEIERLAAAGYGEGEIVELVAVVGLNVFTNYLGRALDYAVDFPAVPRLAEAA